MSIFSRSIVYSKTRETIELAVKSVWPFTGPEVKVDTDLMTCSGQVKGLTKPGKEVYGSWPIARVEVDFHASNAISIEALKLLSRKVKRLTGYEFQFFSIERQKPRNTGLARIRLAFDNLGAAEVTAEISK